ncbi:TonB-dependent receptor [Petrimonas sp. IBARAKI]|nr:TonB-dependent receptor [Petrimonas sp. IBARAKI]
MNLNKNLFKKFCTAFLLLAYFTGIQGAYANLQSASSFPYETMSERMERIQDLGRETNQTLSFDYGKLKNEFAPAFTSRSNKMEEWLERSLINSKFTYEKTSERSYIIVDRKNEVVQSSATQQPGGQVRQVRGTVTDNTNTPLIGVNVVQKGTTNGTVTDMDGNFSLSVPQGSSLVFSYIGFETQEITWSGTQNIQVNLNENSGLLDEIVVVGYGVQKRSDLTGTVASISRDRLENVPNLNIAQAIQGGIPGVMIQNSSAGARGDQTILIRGRNSIKADNEPLIIVDGIPYSGSLNDINPNDVESIEVLKDASAAAIYGSRGSNGVIIITTKEGRSGKTRLSYDGKYMVSKVTKVHNLLTGPEFYDFKMTRNPKAMTKSEEDIYKAGTWTDWTKLALRTGHTNEHNLSLSGSNDNVNYYLGFGVTDVKGVLKNDDYLRLSSRINLETTLLDWLRIGTRTNLSFEDQSGAAVGIDIRANPLTSAYDENGNLTIFPWPDNIIHANNLSPLLYDDEDKAYQIISNNYLDIDVPFIDGLNYQLNTGLRARFRDFAQYRGRDTYDGYMNNGESSIDNTLGNNLIIENILSYRKTFDKHNLFLTGLYSYEKSKSRTNNIDGNKFPNDFLSWFATGEATNLSTSHSFYETNLISQMIRANYSFDSRYLLTLTTRRDGFSGFGQNHKWGIFPSIALGYNIHNESFFPYKETVNELKLRASYGLNGNQAIGPYESLSQYVVANYSAGSTPQIGYKPSRLGLDNLGWESSRTLNLGLDVGLFNNRFNTNINWYLTNTEDLLLDRSISAIHGITPVTHLPGAWIHPSVTSNIGATQNMGIEVGFSSRNIIKRDFQWKTDGNFSFNKNKITSLYKLLDESGNEIDDISNKWFIGHPIRVDYDFIWDGTWQLSEEAEAAIHGSKPGRVKLRDVNKDGVLNAEDRQIIGQQDPKFMWGLSNVFTYKNVSLSVFMHGAHGHIIPNYLMNDNVQGAEVRYNTLKKNWWTPENPTNDWIINEENAAQMNGFSAMIYEKGGFVRIKDISLSYNFPRSFINSKIANLSLYTTGRNLFTFTEWSGLDPELTTERAQRYNPMQKEFVIGLNLSF